MVVGRSSSPSSAASLSTDEVENPVLPAMNRDIAALSMPVALQIALRLMALLSIACRSCSLIALVLDAIPDVIAIC